MSLRTLILRRLVDALTLGVLGFAIYQFAKPGAPLQRWLERRRMDSLTIRTAAALWADLRRVSSPVVTGAVDVDVLEILDYQCPFCRAAQAAVDSAVGLGVRMAVLQLPLRIHPLAESAARAALCAEEAGAFRPMHERLMRATEWQRDTNWVREAELAGITPLDSFEACMSSDRGMARLVEQLQFIDSLRLMGTPTFVSRRGVRRGAISARELEKLAGRT